MTARVSTGCCFPDTPRSDNPAGSVIIYNAEDDIKDTIKPRLMAAGADCKKIRALDMLGGEKGIFYLDKHLYKIERAIDQLEDCRMVIIDPISSFVSADIDSHKSTEVRIVLGELAAMAASKGIAIVVVSHLNKNTQGSAVHRTSGSMAYVAAARSVWGITRDPDDKHRRLFLPIKCNLAQDIDGLAYSLRSSGKVAAVTWEDGAITDSIDDLMRGKVEEKDDSALDEAKWFLEETLSIGPMLCDEIIKNSKRQGIKEKTLYRAKSEMKIRSERVGSRWMWTTK